MRSGRFSLALLTQTFEQYLACWQLWLTERWSESAAQTFNKIINRSDISSLTVNIQIQKLKENILIFKTFGIIHRTSPVCHKTGIFLFWTWCSWWEIFLAFYLKADNVKPKCEQPGCSKIIKERGVMYFPGAQFKSLPQSSSYVTFSCCEKVAYI